MDKVRILDRLISIVSVFMIDKQLVHVSVRMRGSRTCLKVGP